MSRFLVITRWILGVFFALTFFADATMSVVSSVGSLVLAIMLIPPLASFVFTKIPYTFSRKALIIFGVILFLVVASATPRTAVKGAQTFIAPTPTPTITQISTPTPTPVPTPTKIPTPTPYVYVAPTADTGLSNDNYYTNSNGNEVHSPAYSNNAPAGATAVCGDGVYSFSQHRSGTCSHHGGVAEWL